MADDHLMIDIETLGTEPGCVVLSVGACTFGADTAPKMGHGWVLDVDEQARLGLRADPTTALWWLGQSGAARDAVRGADGAGVGATRAALASLVTNRKVWANSPSFDLAILRAMFAAAGLHAPWSFRDERDYRTLVRLAEGEGFVAPPRTRPKHLAKEDALHQAEMVRSAWDHLHVLGGR